MGRLGAILGASWAVLERRKADNARRPSTFKTIGKSLTFTSWGLLGLSWGPLGGLLGRLGAVLGASWAVLERRRVEKARRPKSFQNLRKVNDFGLSGPSWKASWRPLGASWRPLGPSWARLGRLGALSGRLEGLLGRLGGLLGPSWPVLGPSWARKSHARSRAGPQGYGAKAKKI